MIMALSVAENYIFYYTILFPMIVLLIQIKANKEAVTAIEL